MNEGKTGVGIFFCLSGMLITGILLDLKQTVQSPTDFRRVLACFYIRRALRLMPLLYAVLSVSWLISLPPFNQSPWWHFLHLSNIWQYCYRWDGYGSNLWTLSIEEQFYIVWPWLVLLLPVRGLVWFSVLSVICTPLIRWMLLMAAQDFAVAGTRIGDPNLLPFCQLDCLGGGALLAYAARGLMPVSSKALATVVCVFALPAYLILRLGNLAGWLQETMLAMIWIGIVYRCAQPGNSLLDKLLASRLLVYLGQISYGGYLLQGFVLGWWLWFMWSAPVPGYRVLARLGVPADVFSSDLFNTAVWLVGNLTLAAVSWRFLEGPCNRLKSRFPYVAQENA
jgi:peptidoglycan/LPS O-acetylase OafA/YrhL